MKKKYFLVIWVLFLFTGYFLYFSPLSLFHLNQKWNLLKELKKKNQSLENYNASFLQNDFDLEKNDYFIDMGYSKANQIIVDIQLPPLPQSQNRRESQAPNITNTWLSALIFFFGLSLFVMIFLVGYYHKKHNPKLFQSF